MSLLQVDDLHVTIRGTEILRGITLAVETGQTVGIVGESGCGKSMFGKALMGMLPPGGSISRGTAIFEGQELTQLKEKQWCQLRGSDIAMVMQDPFTSLNPVMNVGDQVAESLVLHLGHSWSKARQEAVELLKKVGIPDAANSAKKFPHQLSGGQRQRIVIAIAFACRPKLLIADEPTTALDVTLQAQILRLLKDLQSEVGTSVLLISHNIGVIASVSDSVAVFYAGQVVEFGLTQSVLQSPLHPYTKALLDAMPKESSTRLTAIEGAPPQFSALPEGCAFGPRCVHRFEPCNTQPAMEASEPQHSARCWLYATRLQKGSEASGQSQE